MRNIPVRRVRDLERDRGTVEGGEKLWALLLYAGSATREQALEYFWGVEKREAFQQGHPPDPQRPLTMLRLIDAVYPLRVVQGNLARDRATNLAYQFQGWSREEVYIVASALDPLLIQPSPADESAVLGAAAKIDALFDAAEAVWSQDCEVMRFIAASPGVGGGR
jgi:hypothetical protein